MFKITDNPTFTRTVTIRVPADGGYISETLTAVFNVLPVTEMNSFDLATEKGARAFLTAAIHSLDDIGDENGKPLPYSDQLRDKVLDLPYARAALAEEYTRSVEGAREGN